MKRPLSARISADLDREMREVAERREITISSLIERGIDAYLREVYRREGGAKTRQGQKRKSAQATR